MFIMDTNLTGCDGPVSSWKKYRESIVLCVDFLLSRLTISQKWDLKNEAKILQTKSEHGETASNIEESLWDKFLQCVGWSWLHTTNMGDSRFLVIIDDNMYYRSMRHDILQLARKYTIGFCQVYVETSVELSSARNACRAHSRVMQEVIDTMATKFEVPDCYSYYWEKYSLTVTCAETVHLESVWKLVDTAMDDPVQPLVEEDTKAKSQSRFICSANVIHQMDQILRKLVAQEMALAKGAGMSKDDMKEQAALLSDIRLKILGDMKSGDVTLNFESDMTDASKDCGSYLYRFVQSVFEVRKLETR